MEHRYEGLDAKSDPLVAILAAVPFELFRVKLKTALVKGGFRAVNPLQALAPIIREIAPGGLIGAGRRPAAANDNAWRGATFHLMMGRAA